MQTPGVGSISNEPAIPEMTLTWLGNDGWLIEHENHLIGIDLDLHSRIRMSPSPVPIDRIARDLGYLFITHDHGDHFNVPTCTEFAAGGDCVFFLPESCRPILAESSIPEERVRWVTPRKRYDPEPWLSFETFRALHGHKMRTVYEHANLADCGYCIEFGGKRLFQPGDTVLLSEHLSLSSIDVLFFSPTEHNTHVDDSVLLIETVKPGMAVAQHFGTYETDDANSYWTVGYPDEVKGRLGAEMAERVIVPEQGVAIPV